MVDFDVILYWIPPFSGLLPLFIKPKLFVAIVGIPQYILFTNLFIIIAEYYRIGTGNNLFMFDFIPYFEFGTLGLYLVFRMPNKLSRIISSSIYVLLLIWYTLAFLGLKPFFDSWSILGNSNYGIFLIVGCLVHYAHIMIKQPTDNLLSYPYFWFTSAIFIYFGLGFFLIPMMNVHTTITDSSVLFLSETIHHIPNWLLYSFIFIGLWKAQKTV